MNTSKTVVRRSKKRAVDLNPSKSGMAAEPHDELYGVGELKALLIEAEKALGELRSNIKNLKMVIQPGMMPNLTAFEKDVTVMMNSIEDLLDRVRKARRKNCGNEGTLSSECSTTTTTKRCNLEGFRCTKGACITGGHPSTCVMNPHEDVGTLVYNLMICRLD